MVRKDKVPMQIYMDGEKIMQFNVVPELREVIQEKADEAGVSRTSMAANAMTAGLKSLHVAPDNSEGGSMGINNADIERKVTEELRRADDRLSFDEILAELEDELEDELDVTLSNMKGDAIEQGNRGDYYIPERDGGRR